MAITWLISNATTTNKWNHAHISWDILLNDSTWFLSLKSPRQWWNLALLQKHQDNDNANQLPMSKSIFFLFFIIYKNNRIANGEKKRIVQQFSTQWKACKYNKFKLNLCWQVINLPEPSGVGSTRVSSDKIIHVCRGSEFREIEKE